MAGMEWGGAPGVILAAVIGVFIASKVPSFSESSKEKEGNGNNTSSAEREEDFRFSLLLLCALVIKSDGNSTPNELTYVRKQFIHMFGKEKTNESFRKFNVYDRRHIRLRPVIDRIRRHIPYHSRLQLLHFMLNIGRSDGPLNDAEFHLIHRISRLLYIHERDFASMAAMFDRAKGPKRTPVEASYAILKVTPNSTVEEIKKAYRRLAREFHPDRIQGLGPDVGKVAQEKFIRVQEAYETIRSVRGFK